MEGTREKKKKRYAAVLVLCGLAAVTVLGTILLYGIRAGSSDNLALQKGVIATCDSMENETLSAYGAIDGNDTDRASRWSSENNREDASHYIELEFPEEISVSFVILKWERRNVTSYALEGSYDGETWETLASFDRAPEYKNQEIALEDPAVVRFLRLSTYEVSRSEADYSDLYQNVSLYEFEVYADKPAAYRLGEPTVEYAEDGSRYLKAPEAPEGYEVTYLGADYEQIVGSDGRICHTIQDKWVTVGFLMSSLRDPSDRREVSRTLLIPADDGTVGEGAAEVELAEQQERDCNDCPQVIPALAEWRGGTGYFEAGGSLRVIVEEETTLLETAQVFAEQYRGMMGGSVTVISGVLEDAKPGDIYLGYAEESEGLGAEGYTCDIDDICVIKAETDTGIRWGTVTLLQIFSQEKKLPKGQIRDYPLYQVRGFGIDVARKAVSMDTLYAMMESMSYYKMNDLAIHLNDNVILSTSGLTDSVEQAMTADSAFRLESDIVNAEGEKLTSQEYAYTKEEFAHFIQKAKTYGVTVVPEIDTPAHSLSITKLYPEYALAVSPESSDQIDLSKEGATELVKDIWLEALGGADDDSAAFRDAAIVNIGMDEYYGDGEQYRVYAKEMAEMVRGEDRTVRMWGSLSNMSGRTMPDTGNLQMNIWSTVWADPRQMYEAGYSLINMHNNHLYVIPGGGYDYLDREELYTNWAPNKFYDYDTMEILPSYSLQMLGAAYMIWNDMSGRLDVGICEYDLYDRFEQPLPILAARLWGMPEGAPGAEPDAGVMADTAEEYEEFCRKAAQIDEAAQGVRGEANRLYEDTTGLEPSYEINLRVYLESTPETQIIAESDSPYGVWAFYGAEPETGRVGFAREGRTYTWDYVLPRDQWVELTVVGEPGKTTLYVDGERVGTLGSNKPFEEYATFVFPVQRIGAKTGAFRGEAEMTGEGTEE